MFSTKLSLTKWPIYGGGDVGGDQDGEVDLGDVLVECPRPAQPTNDLDDQKRLPPICFLGWTRKKFSPHQSERPKWKEQKSTTLTDWFIAARKRKRREPTRGERVRRGRKLQDARFPSSVALCRPRPGNIQLQRGLPLVKLMHRLFCGLCIPAVLPRVHFPMASRLLSANHFPDADDVMLPHLPCCSSPLTSLLPSTIGHRRSLPSHCQFQCPSLTTLPVRAFASTELSSLTLCLV